MVLIFHKKRACPEPGQEKFDYGSPRGSERRTGMDELVLDGYTEDEDGEWFEEEPELEV